MSQVALITGAAGGIGRAAVEVFLAAHWEVIAVDLQPMRDYSGRVASVQADVSNEAEVGELMDSVEASTEELGALVNIAAIQPVGSVLETTTRTLDEVLAVNLRSVFLTAREAFPLLQVGAGSVVNVASVHALATSQGLSAYAASKGGVLALTRSLALEFAPHGVRVNAVLPGAVDTQMLKSGVHRSAGEGVSDADMIARLAARTPLGRIGRPEEIAQAILFLADSQQSSFITGQAIVVDGGATARLSTE